MSVTKLPLLMIFNPQNGKQRILVESYGADECSVQLNYLFRGLLNDVEIIDATGKHFSHIKVTVSGLDWKTYLASGAFIGIIVLIFDCLFCAVMVRLRFTFDEMSVQMSLDEIKEKVSRVISSNPNFYTYSPHEEIIRRVNKAKSIVSLINTIVKD